MKLDPAVLELLNLDASNTTVSAGGSGCSSASASIITTQLPDGGQKKFFMKTAKGKEGDVMLTGEFLF